MGVGRLIAGTIPILCLACCSPYPYSAAVKTFSDGVTGVSDTLDSSDTEAKAAMAEAARIRRFYAGPRPSLVLAPDCRSPETMGGRCEQIVPGLATTFPVNDVQPTAPLIVPETAYKCPPLPKSDVAPTITVGKKVTLKMIEKTLKDYAKGLAAITNAADRAALDSAFGDLSKSVATMASTVGMAGGPAISAAAGAIAGPAVKLTGWIVGQAEDQRRFEALDTAVRTTCLPMQALSATVNSLLRNRLNAISASRLESIDNINSARFKKIRSGGMAADEYLKDDVTIDGLIAKGVRPPPASAAGADMGAAHDELVKAVVSRSGQTDALLTSVQTFASSVAALEAAASK